MKPMFAWMFYTLWILDAVFTCIFVSILGSWAEANPLMRWVIENMGLLGFLAVKAIPVCGLAELHKNVPTWVYAGLSAIMLPVVFFGGVMAWLAAGG